jgi:hypothetical protein
MEEIERLPEYNTCIGLHTWYQKCADGARRQASPGKSWQEQREWMNEAGKFNELATWWYTAACARHVVWAQGYRIGYGDACRDRLGQEAWDAGNWPGK